jgi:hypothetical protein
MGLAPQPPGAFTAGHTQAQPPPRYTQVSSPVPGDRRLARQTNLAGMSPKQIQKMLIARGYDVGHPDGKLGSRTKTAMDAYIKGKPPKQYNDWAAQHYRSVVVRGSKPSALAAGGQSNVAGPPPVGGGAAGGGKASGGPKINLAGLDAIGSNIGVDTPEGFADAVAQAQAGQGVTDAQRQIDQAPGQYAQNSHDIEHWYQQVLDSQGVAAGRDKEMGAAGTGSIKDAVAAMVAGLGGSANEGSASVAQAGAQDVGMMQALATNQDQYNQDVRPLMQAESAGASTRERARQSTDMRDLQNKLTDAKTAKGAARIQALMQIRQSNNQLAQQRFENQLNLSNAKEAALMNGLKIANGGLSAVSPNVLAKASNGAMNQFVHYDDQGNQLPGYSTKGMDPQQVVRNVNNAYLGMGLNLKDPRVGQSAMATLRALGVQPDPRWYS